MPVSQPRIRNYNRTRILWTDEETEYLIDQRMSRNEEFWNLSIAEQVDFWASVARKINECFSTQFTAGQTKIKWKNLVKEHNVNINIFY